MTIKAYGSTYGNIDRYGTYMVKGAFDKGLKQLDSISQIKILRNHDMDKLLTSATDIYNDDKGLVVEFTLKKGIDLIDETMEYIRRGDITTMSVGFMLRNYERDDKRKAIAITEGYLFEISVTPLPVNLEAKFIKLKSMDTRGLEALLRDVEGVSHKTAKAIVSKLSELSEHDQRDADDTERRSVEDSSTDDVQPDNGLRDEASVSPENEENDDTEGQRDADDDVDAIASKFMEYVDEKDAKESEEEADEVSKALEQAFQSFTTDDKSQTNK